MADGIVIVENEECSCDDPRYTFRIVVDGIIVHEATLDLEKGDGDEELALVTAEQMPFVDDAIKNAKPWQASSWCPACMKGQIVAGNSRPKALNLLVPREEGDPRDLVIADCGHHCIATYVTRRRMADPNIDNVTVCIPCFDADPDRWRTE